MATPTYNDIHWLTYINPIFLEHNQKNTITISPDIDNKYYYK